MGLVSLELWPGKVILVVALHHCFSCFTLSGGYPGKDLIDIPGNDIKAPHEDWFRREARAVPGRKRSYIEVSASEVSATTEAELLLEFRKAVIADPFHVLSGWNNITASNYCSWGGVNCSGPNGPVNAIDLSGFQLQGSISPVLGGLQFLSALNLSRNHFGGTIPPSIANCSDLVVLDLSNNTVDGIIPTEFSALARLEHLDLSNNFLTGALPPLLSNLSALKVLVLGANLLQGDMMSLAWGGFAKLQKLDLTGNKISGAIPESLSNCSSLCVLDLTSNSFTGIIPESFAKLQKLQVLALGYNSLIGSIPPALGGLKALSILYVPFNSLTGHIPQTLANCSSLTGLYLSWNQLTGSIPQDIGLLSQLQNFYLWNNSLTGSIPPSLVNCTSLANIIIPVNFFDGVIPQGMGTLRQLEYLYLHTNNIVGMIPEDLANSSTLQEIVFNNNGIHGEIPFRLGFLKNLSKLDLSSNGLSGVIPATLGDASALISLDLANNQLTGEIPTSIGKLIVLQGFSVSDNILTGGIPAELSNCTQLSVLDLSRNFLSGNLPDGLGALTALNQLYVNNNNLTGSILPALTQQSTSLIEISVAHNRFSGVINEYNFGSLRNLQLNLDLSHNLFTGPLPSWIGALKSVQKINLSSNSFSGVITGAFSQCVGLESLDLSFNNLDGEIPESLATLQQLTLFNVSFNQLSGSVPDSGQFANFTDASFLGNPHLCGAMLLNKCKRPSACRGIRCHLLAIIIPTVVVSVIAVLAAIIRYLVIGKRRLSGDRIAGGVPDESRLEVFSAFSLLDQVVAATNAEQKAALKRILVQTIENPGGENVIGVGARSIVYKGVLPGGESFAVKRLLSSANHEDDDQRNYAHSQFSDAGTTMTDMNTKNRTVTMMKEANMLATFRHTNILKVLGFFSSCEHKALIVEYMSGGSLHTHLHEMQPCKLKWETRLNIAMGVAQGLKYLHHDFPQPLIHRDLKPRNILLDANFHPKIGDFGISQFVTRGRRDGVATASTFSGTIGYMPPEYASQPWVSTKGDVYSYGMVLIELLTLRQPASLDTVEDQGRDLRNWVLENFDERPLALLDPFLILECSVNDRAMKQILLLLRVSMFCTLVQPQGRPSMVNVVTMLTNIVNEGEEPKVRKTIEELIRKNSK